MNIVRNAAILAVALAGVTDANAATVTYSGPCAQFCYFSKVAGTVTQVSYDYTFNLSQQFAYDMLNEERPTYRLTGVVNVSGASAVAYDLTQTAPTGTFAVSVAISQLLTGGLSYYEGVGEFEAGAFTQPTYTYVSGSRIGDQIDGGTFSDGLRIVIDYIPTPAIPEPSTWALMLAGFGIMGHALRRRPTLSYAQ
jgi:hypothetical protein